MQVKDLNAGDNIEVIELVVKNVSQGKFGKPPGNTPYQHLWLTDGTGDIRFSLFGDDVNKLQEGQMVRIVSSYVKEYPAGSGKLQIALGKDGGNWQIVSGSGQPVDRDDVVAAPIQIVSSDAIEEHIVKQTCLKVMGRLWQGTGDAVSAEYLLATAQAMYEWVMGEDEKSRDPKMTQPAESRPADGLVESHPAQLVGAGTGPQATKLKLIAEAGIKENSGWTGPPTMDLIQKFAATMNGILGGDKERHTWLKWTYGVESSKEATGAKLQVVLDMLDATYTNKKWIPTKEGAAEAIKAMFKQALIDAGQTEMSFKESVEEVYGP